MQHRIYKNKKRKKHKELFVGAIIVLGIAILAVIVILLFRVQKIEVTGTTYSDSDEIVHWVQGDSFSGNALYLVVKNKFAQEALPPYLDGLQLSLKAPRSVRVSVEEKKIAASFILGEEHVYFDKSGLVVAKSKEGREGVPSVEGIQVNEAILYKKLKVTEKNVFQNILEVTEAVRNEELTPDRIVCTGADISLYFGNVCVQLGSKNFSDRIAQIAPIMAKLNGQGGTLHLESFEQGSSNPSFLPGDIYAEQHQAEAEQAAAEQAAAEQAAAEQAVLDGDSDEDTNNTDVNVQSEADIEE